MSENAIESSQEYESPFAHEHEHEHEYDEYEHSNGTSDDEGDGLFENVQLFGIPNWVVGVLVIIVSAFSSALGNVAMKHGQKKEEEKEGRGEKVKKVFGNIPYTNPWWWLGFFTLVVAPTPLDTFAFSVAGASMLSTVGCGLTIVFSLLLARLIKERLTRIDWISNCLIITGAALTTAFGTHASPRYSVSTLLSFWGSTPFLVWLLIMLPVALVGTVLWHGFPKLMLAPKSRPLTMVMLSWITASWSALQLIVLKNTGELLKNTSVRKEGEEAPYERPEAWVFLLSVPIIGVAQIVYINHGLKHFPAISFVPAYNTLLVVFAGITGALYFQEYATFHPVAFPFGVIFISVGIALLALKSKFATTAADALPFVTPVAEPPPIQERDDSDSDSGQRHRHSHKHNSNSNSNSYGTAQDDSSDIGSDDSYHIRDEYEIADANNDIGNGTGTGTGIELGTGTGTGNSYSYSYNHNYDDEELLRRPLSPKGAEMEAGTGAEAEAESEAEAEAGHAKATDTKERLSSGSGYFNGSRKQPSSSLSSASTIEDTPFEHLEDSESYREDEKQGGQRSAMAASASRRYQSGDAEGTEMTELSWQKGRTNRKTRDNKEQRKQRRKQSSRSGNDGDQSVRLIEQ